MDIQVDTLQLLQKSDEIRGVKSELEDIMAQIEALVLSANGSWQGEAERAFAEKILYVREQFAGIATFFDGYAQLLQSFSSAYEQLDKNLATKIQMA